MIGITVTGIGIVLAFGVSCKELYESNRTRQLELLTNVFNNIKQLELKLYKDYKDKDEQTKREWDSLLFNSIEYFAFLVNKKYVKDKKMICFFKDAIINWYEKIFLGHYEFKDIDDISVFPEMKELYKKLKYQR